MAKVDKELVKPNTRQKDKEAAKVLFMSGMSQKEIAEILDRTEATISEWGHQGHWREERSEKTLYRETNEERIWKMIDFQCMIIEQIIDAHKSDVNSSMSVGELRKLLIANGEIDALQKLFTTIKAKELDWSSLVKLIREFTEYVQSRDVNIAQALIPIAHEFINDHR